MTRRAVLLALGLGVLVAGTLVAAQPGGGGGGRQGGMRWRGAMPVMGKIVSADVATGTLEVEVYGQKMTVYVVRATKLTKFEETTLDQLAPGATVDLNGMPLKLRAASVRAPLPVAETADAAPGGPFGGGGRPGGIAAMFGGGPGVNISGKVKSVDPFVVTVEGAEGATTDVEVELAEGAKISREVEATWDLVVPGAAFRGQAERNDRDQTVLNSLTLDPAVADMLAAMPAMPGQ